MEFSKIIVLSHFLFLFRMIQIRERSPTFSSRTSHSNFTHGDLTKGQMESTDLFDSSILKNSKVLELNAWAQLDQILIISVKRRRLRLKFQVAELFFSILLFCHLDSENQAFTLPLLILKIIVTTGPFSFESHVNFVVQKGMNPRLSLCPQDLRARRGIKFIVFVSSLRTSKTLSENFNSDPEQHGERSRSRFPFSSWSTFQWKLKARLSGFLES